VPVDADLPLSARLSWSALFALEHLTPAGGACARALRERRRRIVERLARTPARRAPLRRAVEEGELSAEEFRRRQARELAPFVFRGAAREWRCVRRWSAEEFGRRFGSDKVCLLDLQGLRHGTLGPRVKDVTMADLAASVAAGKDDYLRFAPLAAGRPELADDVDLAWLRARGGREPRDPLQFFIGAQGTGTPLHGEVPGNFLIQVEGRKRLLLHPPRTLLYLEPDAARLAYFCSDADPERPESPAFPLYGRADSFDTTLGPGDVLWIPPFWWHHTWNLSPATLAVGYRTTTPAMAVRSCPLLAALRLLARSSHVEARRAGLLAAQRDIYPR
jgi:hypothetical protein